MDFPESTSSIALQWVANVMTELPWEKDYTRPIMKGEAGGFFVVSKNFPFRGYLKPTKADQRYRAAYEKIISDIARHVGVLAPPVLLFNRNEAAELGQEIRTCISLEIYPIVVPWRDRFISDLNYLREALARGSGIIAFDTYIGNTDRNNAGNIIFGFEDDEEYAEAVFLDFCNSMNYDAQWDDNRFRNIKVPDMPQLLLEVAARPIIEEVVARIEGLEDGFINAIVNRIPENHLSAKERKVVLCGLLERRYKIRPIINDYLRKVQK